MKILVNNASGRLGCNQVLLKPRGLCISEGGEHMSAVRGVCDPGWCSWAGEPFVWLGRH